MFAVIILLRTFVVFMAAVVAFLSALDSQSCDLLSCKTVGCLPRLCRTNGRYRIMITDLISTIRNRKFVTWKGLLLEEQLEMMHVKSQYWLCRSGCEAVQMPAITSDFAFQMIHIQVAKKRPLGEMLNRENL